MSKSAQKILQQEFEGQDFSGIMRLLLEIVRPFLKKLVPIALITAAAAAADALMASLFVPLMQVLSNTSTSTISGFGPLTRISSHFMGDYSANEQLRLLGVCFILVMLFAAIFQYWSNLSIGRFTTETGEMLRRKMFEAYLSADYQFFLDRRQGRLLDDVVQQPQAATRALGIALEVLRDIFTIGALATVLISISWKATLLAAAIGGLLGLLMERLRLHALVVGKDDMVNRRALSSLISEVISGIRQVKLFGAEKRITKQHADFSFERIRVLIRSLKMNMLPASVSIATIGLLIGFILIGASFLNATYMGNVLPVLAAFALVTLRLLPVLASVSSKRLKLFQQAITLRYITSVLNYSMPKTNPAANGNRTFTKLTNEIRLNNVDFMYRTSSYTDAIPSRPKWTDPEMQLERTNGVNRDGDKHVLKNLSMTFKVGTKTGIVGLSGGGKSTIVDILVRLFEIQNGSITVDGIDLKDINLSSWRKNIGFVSQETFLFGGTIRENIAFSTPDATDEAIERAARIANIHDLIGSLPDGYDTLIGERGVKLSGGQRQRIAIARAVLSDPPILIFDEATSSLDIFTEGEVQVGIDHASKGRTVIVIAHRLSTVASCDSIYAISNGQVIEHGTHNELIKKGGYYAKCYLAATAGTGSVAKTIK